jgi:S-adenosylmethionine hydrolase
VVALLTDFGTRDSFVAAMKGVILCGCPDAALIDITHEIPPQDVLAGAWHLRQAVPYLPRGAVVVAVVDPGVGSQRASVVVEAGRWLLVGPDNGLFGPLLDDATRWGAPPRAWRLRAGPAPLTGGAPSRTFHGRDVFAPAAARLAAGAPCDTLGDPLLAPLTRARWPQPARVGPRTLRGEVLLCDHFGNLITNITADDLRGLEGAPLRLDAGAIITRWVSHFAEAPPGSLALLMGSAGHLEVVEAMGSAAARLGVGRGAGLVIGAEPAL